MTGVTLMQGGITVHMNKTLISKGDPAPQNVKRQKRITTGAGFLVAHGDTAALWIRLKLVGKMALAIWAVILVILISWKVLQLANISARLQLTVYTGHFMISKVQLMAVISKTENIPQQQ